MSQRSKGNKVRKNTGHFASQRIVFFLCLAILGTNLLFVSIVHSAVRKQCLGILALLCVFTLVQGFETRKTRWEWSYILVLCVTSFFFSAVLLFSFHNENYYALYCMEVLLFLLVVTLIFMVKPPCADDAGTDTRKQVIVYKCKAHRFGIWLLSAAIILASAIVISLTGLKPMMVILLISIPLPVMLPLLLYFGTWYVVFDAKSIHRRVFGLKTRSYSWHQIQETRSAHYSMGGTRITVTFTNNKSLHFQMHDENAAQAVKWLQSHCSIKDSRK